MELIPIYVGCLHLFEVSKADAYFILQVQVEDSDLVFYLDDVKAADAVLNANRQITLTGDNRVC